MAAQEGSVTREIELPAAGAILHGTLVLPGAATSVILFAHGSGSGRWSPRNQFVAGELQKRGFGTLLMDLLTEEEEATDARTGQLRFDIDLLAKRVAAATVWLSTEAATMGYRIGYFGASTGAAAALQAAAQGTVPIGAVVSRGGRPDLAGACLPKVHAPTLLIVGGSDMGVLPLNQEALKAIKAVKELATVPGASHLFEEPGAMEQVARLAGDWFSKHLGVSAAR
ncbi:MAG: dienelactone hydrolase family protein [Gemmatimonadota bacterium]|nr:dienelactone hydrolase family protein [Gemmatimonadota bacterium]